MNSESGGRLWMPALVVGAVGVVYGDIGTSPLYALRECFSGALQPSSDNVLGVLSLIFWSLISLVSVKYIAFVMRADNKGEGGILALLALAMPDRAQPGKRGWFLLSIGIFGAALLFGDGIITPAMTVLSAVEGLNVATSGLAPFVVPITVVILIVLFVIQRHGTGTVGRIFGPVMVFWFITLAVLGVGGIVKAPEVIRAINPLYGLNFFLEHGWTGFVVLGSVFLAVTGVEALYADMGHFGARSIRQAWFGLVLPALFLNYLGQGALLLHDPAAKLNPFFLLAPSWAQYPLVALSTVAAIIACQAMISGVFSISMQAVQLGFLPRLGVTHTSSEQRGQIYVAKANWTLMTVCIALVLGFRSSGNLAAAYGIAVSLTMLMTTILFYFSAHRLWGWSHLRAGIWVAVFLSIELSFCSANLLKVAHGGWVPLLIGGLVFVVMTTWLKGRRQLSQKLRTSLLPLDLFLQELTTSPPVRVPGTAVFMAGNPNGTPIALLHNVKHNKVLHERNVLLTVLTTEVAHVDEAERIQIEKLPHGFLRVVGKYGFMDEPNVPVLLHACKPLGLKFNMSSTTFFLSQESIIAGNSRGMAAWRKLLFSVMSRNSQRATAFFHLPPNRVVELGMQVEL